MAKPSAKKSDTKVTRIKASDAKASTKAAKPTTSAKTKKPSEEQQVTKPKKARRNVFVRMGAYFKGAWQELRLVRWPDRKSTWGMTGALILFTLFFVVVILLLDYGFSQLFKLILGS